MTTIEQDNLLNIWVTNRRTSVNLALANSNPVSVFEVLLAVDPTNVILTSLSVNDDPGKITTMYQMAGGPMPSPGTANEIIYLRANWTDAQIATQIASLYNSTVLYQLISGLTSAMIKSGLAAGNGIYDCCNLFGTLSTSTADTTVRNVMRDLYGNKTDQKSILVANANKTYLLGLCSSHDWSNFVDNSLGLYYQNMALALTDINYNLSSYLSKVQAAIGKSSFTTMLSGLDLTITNEWVAEEHFMYGSSRLGVYRSNKILSKETFEVLAVDGYGNITEKNRLDSFVYVLRTDSFTRVLTQKNYELTNHLGNVLAVVSDRRTPTSAGGINIDYYEADVTSATLYYPFGMELKTYAADSNGYRFGMNMQEKDDEIFKGAYSAEYWEYDSRIGRRWNVDPMTAKYPWQSPYACFNNNPILYNDINGDEAKTEVIPAGHKKHTGADGKSLYVPDNASIEKYTAASEVKIGTSGTVAKVAAGEVRSFTTADGSRYVVTYNTKNGTFIGYKNYVSNTFYENPNNWSSAATIEQKDFVRYSETWDCEDAARKTCNNADAQPGWRNSGTTMEADNSNQPKNDQLVIDRQAGVDLINANLKVNKPVLVGLSYKNADTGEPQLGNSKNRNKLVGHFVVIVGYGVENGKTVYYYWDNAFNYNAGGSEQTTPIIKKIFLDSDNRIANDNYFVADVRPNL